MGALYILEEFRGNKYGYILIQHALNGVSGDVFIDCNNELASYYLDF